MSLETRETLFHGQLQEGLCHHLMKAPAVSGGLTSKEQFKIACSVLEECESQTTQVYPCVPLCLKPTLNSWLNSDDILCHFNFRDIS